MQNLQHLKFFLLHLPPPPLLHYPLYAIQTENAVLFDPCTPCAYKVQSTAYKPKTQQPGYPAVHPEHESPTKQSSRGTPPPFEALLSLLNPVGLHFESTESTESTAGY
ncbi:hypothetical protein N7462_003016 [Penicillium macrosclerotiorum]|uniref:uncharacterized protein n=1 Tax=Penicillium macrosclerotiorum TaxID=303699 RepID=UPI0025493017|nr:uncharacterized protein N7462_003016 [Penicillium macrosclerotiorum]KAJ5688624.1 hypothetical protein N7462_003016 [Penicillium macrosclerotiorum]